MTNKFVSFLDAVGKDFKKGLADVLPFAEEAEPIISALDPAAGAILSTTLGVVLQTEQKFAAMGQQSGTGTQKLAEVTAILTPVLTTALSEAGEPATAEQIEKYVNDAVAILNDIPAAPTATT